MPSRDEIYKKVVAQAILRELDAEVINDLVVVHYPRPQSEREDNLHKQSIRSLIKRVDPQGEWRVHLIKLGESGFSVEVRPAPGLQASVVEPEPEAIEPAPVKSLAKIAAQLRELAARLEGAA